jgi:hypothetical protein
MQGGQPRTLGHALALLLPEVGWVDEDEGGGGGGGAVGSGDVCLWSAGAIKPVAAGGAGGARYTAVVQGVVPPLSAPCARRFHLGCGGPFWLRFTYVAPVLVKKY